ncbi:hypothetical protein [Neobacillus drentensis]
MLFISNRNEEKRKALAYWQYRKTNRLASKTKQRLIFLNAYEAA